ncbi:MAG TPA: hypothetical protein IAB32_04825 [Candidatus Scatosoma pullicola]|nr:hypothetical protein [Candidatus Scatosoma pullicola]
MRAEFADFSRGWLDVYGKICYNNFTVFSEQKTARKSGRNKNGAGGGI